MNKTQDSQTLLADQVNLLYRQASLGASATLINAGILVAALWAVQSRERLLTWVATITLVTLGRLWANRNFKPLMPGDTEAAYWRDRYVIGAVLAGATWGAAGVLLFPVHYGAHQTVLMTVLAGMSAGAVPFLTSVPAAYAGYVLPILGPLAVWLFMQQQAVHTFLGLTVLVFLGVLFVISRRLYQNILESLSLRDERKRLVERLSKSKRELESINAQLFEEVQERLKAEKELEENAGFLARIMDASTDAIVVVSSEQRIERVNRAMENITGKAAAQLLGVALSEVFQVTSGQGINALLDEMAKNGRAVSSEAVHVLRSDGETRLLSVSLAPLAIDGQVHAAVMTAQDITDRRAVERMKERFLSTVSHELRTPLTSIHGSLQLVRSGAVGNVPESIDGLIGIAASNSERLVRLVDDLLDAQRLGAARMQFQLEPADLDPLIDQAISANQPYADRFDVTFRREGSVKGMKINVDRGRFIQVMTNLLANAAKFSPPGAPVIVHSARDAGMACISVIDQGPGISDEFRAQVFERFAQEDASDTRRRGGTGLGLSISKEMVEAMGGTIDYHSTPGEGTEFQLQFPVA